MATQRIEGSSGGAGGSSMSFDDAIGPDLLHNVLSRLPATSFAAAACVNRYWNSTCSRILSSPKLSSALSLNPSLQEAVNEVVEKVLLEPIRPQFVIAYLGPKSHRHAHRLITKRFSCGIPVLTSLTAGIIGTDALTDEFKEIMWETEIDDADKDLGHDREFIPNRGILLTVGYLPGVKVKLIRLSARDEELRDLLIDEFVMDIREYTSSVSGSASPSGIILFSDVETDMRPVLQKMDYAFPSGTIIVGEGGGGYNFHLNEKELTRRQKNPALALVFVNDMNRPPGIGETQFHVALSTGTTPFGPKYEAASVEENYNHRFTLLTARREGVLGDLNGNTILADYEEEDGFLYIGVRKRRKCSVGLEEVRWKTFLEFHEVFLGDEEGLFVNELGIRSGDSFQLYLSDPNIAMSACNNISENFRRLKEDFDKNSNRKTHFGITGNSNKESVFGGLIFTSFCRNESFFGRPNIDSRPFLETFPGVTLTGTFSYTEIKREHLSEEGQEDQGDSQCCCSHHVFSTVYLVFSYIPALPQG